MNGVALSGGLDGTRCSTDMKLAIHVVKSPTIHALELWKSIHYEFDVINDFHWAVFETFARVKADAPFTFGQPDPFCAAVGKAT
jgi:hypothetical protein